MTALGWSRKFPGKMGSVAFVLLGAPLTAWAQPMSPEIRAQVSPRDFTTLAAEIGAKVEKITVREGERFSKGEILVAFECSIQKAQVDEARTILAAAEKTVVVNQRLLALQSVGRLETEMAMAETDKARARLVASAAVMAKCAVAAPFAGWVVEQRVRAQQFVQPGQARRCWTFLTIRSWNWNSWCPRPGSCG